MKKMGDDFLLFILSVLYYRLLYVFCLGFEVNNWCLVKVQYYIYLGSIIKGIFCLLVYIIYFFFLNNRDD